MSDLDDRFVQYNREYFGDRLPRYRVLRRRRRNCVAACYDERRLITIHPDQVGDDLAATLLHEMCHIGGGRDGHGPRFQARMRRLQARLPAPLAAKVARDVDGYDPVTHAHLPTVSLKSAIASEVEAIAIARPNTRWSTIRLWLVKRFELRPDTNRRHRDLLTWSEQVWRNKARASRENARDEKRFLATLSRGGELNDGPTITK